MPGDYPFYFDDIQATSEVINGIYGNNNDALVYTVMTTSENAIDGSAICVYSMNSVLNAFEGKFMNQRDVNSIWRSLDESEMPSIRPGKCVDDSRTLPMSTVNFILKNPLMGSSISPIHNAPFLVHTGLNYKFTSIAIDPQIEALNGKLYDVIFIGTDKGQILKVINSGNSIEDIKPIVISEHQVFPLGTRVKEMKISQITQTMIVISDDIIKVMPLFNCSELSQCSQCINSRDPYCVWDTINRECIFYNMSTMKGKVQIYMENIDERNDNACGNEIMANINQQKNTQNKNNIQTHGTITGKGTLPNDSDIKNDEKELYHHKYQGVTIIQGKLFSFVKYLLKKIIGMLYEIFKQGDAK